MTPKKIALAGYHVLQYIKRRMGERSFYVGVTLAISAAAVLPHPWDIVSFIAGVAGSLVPDGRVGKDTSDPE